MAQGTIASVPLSPPFVAPQNGATPLFVAAFNGHVDVVKALLEHGADADKAEQVAGPHAYSPSLPSCTYPHFLPFPSVVPPLR